VSARRHRYPPPLTVVTMPAADDARRAAGGRDWSKLMARAQDGDRQAYRTLLQDLAPYLRSIAGRCFKQSSDVEDAVQDVLLTIHVVRHAYDPSRPFGPWLKAIANRRIIDRLRHAKRRAKLRSRPSMKPFRRLRRTLMTRNSTRLPWAKR
jgi:RNA polymerase sigma-70 factor, ECF subfamily